MFDSIFQMLGLDMFTATTMADFFPQFFKFLVALCLLITLINAIFDMVRNFTRGRI